MAEDFDDFGDFASAFPTTSGVNDAKATQTTTSSAINQANSTEKVDFFASFPPPISSTSGDAAPLNFASFDAFSNHTSEGVVDGGEISGFGQFDVANMDLTELKIPSPTDPNIHMAGGVAFDIPPILDDDFSNPSSPTALPNQVQFQGDIFSADFTKSETNQDMKETPTDIQLSFPTSGPQQGSHQEAQEDTRVTKDDSFGDFESSFSLKTSADGLKTTAEPSNMEGGNFGLFPENSIAVAGGNTWEATSSGQVPASGDNLKSGDDFGEFGDFTQSTGIDNETEASTLTNIGNSLDIAGFANFESTANSKSESKQPDTSKNLVATAIDPVPLGGDGFASFDRFQSSEATEKANQDSTTFGDFASSNTMTAQETSFGAFTGSISTAAQDDSTQVGDFGAFSTATDVQKDDPAATAQCDAQFSEFGAFSTSSTTNTKGDTEFGSFGAFQTPAADSSTTAPSDSHFGDFGAFSSSSTGNDAKEDDFGNFGVFQTESTSTAVPSSTSTTQGGDDFGAFADSTSKDDEFGDFSTSDSGFGNFTSSEPVPKPKSNNAVLKVS